MDKAVDMHNNMYKILSHCAEKRLLQKSLYHFILFVKISRKCKLIYGDQKRICNYLGQMQKERRTIKGLKKSFGGNGNVMYFNLVNGFSNTSITI